MSTSMQSIREIVKSQPSAAAVLGRFDIDLCSHGSASLDQVCAELQLSVEQVLEKLTDAETQANGAEYADPARMTVDRLIQHIVRVHHQYVRRELPQLAAMAHKLAARHGQRAAELNEIAELVAQLRADLMAHLEKEEQILFPYIAQMDQDAMFAFAPQGACFGSVTQPVFMMAQEHESAERIVAQLDRLMHGFEAPDWACTTHVAFYGGLRQFKDDLRRHVHLENDVLFPLAIEMEGALSLGR